MPWSGGTYTRTDGTRNGSTVCQQTKAAGIGDLATLADLREQDLATGLNNCVTRDGTTSPSADLPMGTHKHTGVGQATGAGQYTELAQVQALIAALIPPGTKMLFFQAAAPTGWTQDTTHNDRALRIVSGSGGGSKTNGQAFSAAAALGTVDGHAITVSEMPSHSHSDSGHTHQVGNANAVGGGGVSSGGQTGLFFRNDPTIASGSGSANIQNTGGGGTHTHTFTSSQFGLNYIDCIVCTKN